MSTTEIQTQREVATAWGLWNALNEHAEALWERYEVSFIDLIMEEQRLEAVEPPPAFETEIDIEDDIPF